MAASSRSSSSIFLGFSALVWVPYGLYCFVQPSQLHEAAGVAFTSPTGSTELRAMYGGLQIGIGLLALLGVVRRERTRTALTALAFLCGGLGSARALGVLLDGGVSSYTALGLAFEWGSTVAATLLLRG